MKHFSIAAYDRIRTAALFSSAIDISDVVAPLVDAVCTAYAFSDAHFCDRPVSVRNSVTLVPPTSFREMYDSWCDRFPNCVRFDSYPNLVATTLASASFGVSASPYPAYEIMDLNRLVLSVLSDFDGIF